jgi:hypothetical protein
MSVKSTTRDSRGVELSGRDGGEYVTADISASSTDRWCLFVLPRGRVFGGAPEVNASTTSFTAARRLSGFVEECAPPLALTMPGSARRTKAPVDAVARVFAAVPELDPDAEVSPESVGVPARSPVVVGAS